MPSEDGLEQLRPYEFHGIDLKINGDNAYGVCPFCSREGKFGVNVKSGLWRCVVCEKHGNHVNFVREFWEFCDDNTKPEMYDELVQHRKFIDSEVLIQWEVVKSPTTDNWIVPGYNADGKMVQLYKYYRDGKGNWILCLTPVLRQQLFGVGLYDKAKPIVFLCEGPWDGMALWEVLRAAKLGPDKENFEVSHNYGETVLAESNVLATPGANVFNPSWSKLFAGKTVYILFDNDYPKKHELTEKLLDPVGFNGMKRTAGILTGSETPPEQILFLNWGENGYTEAFPNGTDVRDLLTVPELL